MEGITQEVEWSGVGLSSHYAMFRMYKPSLFQDTVTLHGLTNNIANIT